MNIQKINCPSCGAIIQVNESTEIQKCDFCKTSFSIESKDGIFTAKLLKNVEKTIKDVSDSTQSTIRESSQTTQNELKKIQLQTQITSLQSQLSIINSDIRNIERSKRNRKQRRQLRELKSEKMILSTNIEELKDYIKQIDGEKENDEKTAEKKSKHPKKKISLNKGCLPAFFIFIVIFMIFGGFGTLIDRAIWGIEENAANPFYSIAVVLAFIIGIMVYYLKNKPDSNLSIKITGILDNIHFLKQIPKWLLIIGIGVIALIGAILGFPTESSNISEQAQVSQNDQLATYVASTLEALSQQTIINTQEPSE